MHTVYSDKGLGSNRGKKTYTLKILVFVMSCYVSLRSDFREVMSFMISA
jgi:hypothetical protein